MGGDDSLLSEEFDRESNELINKVCDVFHDELRALADKYGVIYLGINVVG